MRPGIVSRFATTAAAVLALGALGCSERHPLGSILFELAVSSPEVSGPARLVATGDSVVVAIDRETIIIRRVELVLQKIELAPFDAGDCEGSPDEHEEECAQLEPGLVLLELPLGNAAEHLLQVKVPVDTFSLLQFLIHKPDMSRDRAFISAHPDFSNRSLRLQGTFSRSGTRSDFVYTSDFNEREELALDPPLTVASGGTARLTLHIGLESWFLTADKTALVDPATANPGRPNEHLVRDNIRTSLRAFRDDDHDDRNDQIEPGR